MAIAPGHPTLKLRNIIKPPYPELSRTPQKRLATVEGDVRATPEIAGYQSYESFANNNSKLREEFIAAETGNLDLHYTRFVEPTLDGLVQLAHQTEGTLVTLLGSERDEKTEALFDAIEYRNSEMFMVHMSARMNDKSLSPEERAEAAEWYKLANENLYDTPIPKCLRQLPVPGYSLISPLILLITMKSESSKAA